MCTWRIGILMRTEFKALNEHSNQGTKLHLLVPSIISDGKPHY